MGNQPWTVEAGRDALREAIICAGGQEKFSELLGRPQSTVSYWLTGSKFGVPAEECRAIEQNFGIPRWRLRGDLWDAPVEETHGAL